MEFNLENIRKFLTEGFSEGELRRFFFDSPKLRPVYDQLAEITGKAEIIDRAIEFAERKMLLGDLLAKAKEYCPNRYELHQPYIGYGIPDIMNKEKEMISPNEESPYPPWFGTVETTEKMFKEAIEYLTRDNRDELRIYAPTGIWLKDIKKKEWFKTVAGCLVNAHGLPENVGEEHIEKHIDTSVTTKLGSFTGVYGLPSIKDQHYHCEDCEGGKVELHDAWLGHCPECGQVDFLAAPGRPPEIDRQLKARKTRQQELGLLEVLERGERVLLFQKKESDRQVNNVENLLLSFHKLDYATLYYLDVNVCSLPGTGVIIIDKSVFLAFATGDKYKVDYALCFLEREEIAKKMRDWFEKYIKSIVEGNIIQIGIGEERKTVLQGLDDLREERYGLPRKYKDQPVGWDD